MTGGQIASLIFAILLLLPGGCFLFFGTAGGDADDPLVDVPIAAVILALAGWLFWLAFRRRPGGRKPPVPPT